MTNPQIDRLIALSERLRLPLSVIETPDYAEIHDEDGIKVALTIQPELITEAVNAIPALASEFKALRAKIAELEGALTKISAIRDSIIGVQGFNWSEHAYPLVAALDAAGFSGAGYKIARENVGTLIEQVKQAEAERDAASARVKAMAGALEAIICMNRLSHCPCDEWVETDPAQDGTYAKIARAALAGGSHG